MLRTFLCAAVALILAANLSLAAGKNAKKNKKDQAFAGTVKSVDAAAGKLTISVKKKKVFEDKDFKVGDSVKVVAFAGADKKKSTGKVGLKEIKTGDKIHVQTDDAGNVVSIRTGDRIKKAKKSFGAQ